MKYSIDGIMSLALPNPVDMSIRQQGEIVLSVHDKMPETTLEANGRSVVAGMLRNSRLCASIFLGSAKDVPAFGQPQQRMSQVGVRAGP